jgi:hypothetical protein
MMNVANVINNDVMRKVNSVVLRNNNELLTNIQDTLSETEDTGNLKNSLTTSVIEYANKIKGNIQTNSNKADTGSTDFPAKVRSYAQFHHDGDDKERLVTLMKAPALMSWAIRHRLIIKSRTGYVWDNENQSRVTPTSTLRVKKKETNFMKTPLEEQTVNFNEDLRDIFR